MNDNITWLEGRYETQWFDNERVFKKHGIYDYFIDVAIGIRWSDVDFWEDGMNERIINEEQQAEYQNALLTAILLGIHNG
jgi:hypothetical protein